jgi:hypothetical protein
MENLFSYGTLQLEAVQKSTFNRILNGSPDAILGYKMSMLEITDPGVIATSGKTHHPIISYTGQSTDSVEGTVFKVTPDELLQADRYEVSDYQRVQVPLRSGGQTWVYVSVKDQAQ